MSEYETYQHPNGTRPLTRLGFLQSEADRNGTTLEEEMEDQAKIMREIEREYVRDLRERAPDILKVVLREELASWKDEKKYVRKLKTEYNRWKKSGKGDCWIKPEHLVYSAARPPQLKRLIYLKKVLGHDSFKESSMTMLALIQGTDNRFYLVRIRSSNYRGDFYEPPSSETYVNFRRLKR